jgi:biopolymer transport protein ExbB
VINDLLQRTLEYIETGGFVMYPLLFVSLLMFFLVIMKLLEMYDFTKGDRPIKDCLESLGKPVFTAAPWQRDIIKGFLADRTFDEDLDRSILEALMLRQGSFVDRYIKSIAILAGVAPLLGLLGTVNGMIATFSVIATAGTGDAKALASGISEALITTQTGLVVAVPGLFLANYLRRRSEKLKSRMHRFCLGLLRSHRAIEG